MQVLLDLLPEICVLYSCVLLLFNVFFLLAFLLLFRVKRSLATLGLTCLLSHETELDKHKCVHKKLTEKFESPLDEKHGLVDLLTSDSQQSKDNSQIWKQCQRLIGPMKGLITVKLTCIVHTFLTRLAKSIYRFAIYFCIKLFDVSTIFNFSWYHPLVPYEKFDSKLWIYSKLCCNKIRHLEIRYRP